MLQFALINNSMEAIMKKLKQSLIVIGVLLTLSSVIALSASPSTRSEIAEKIKSGVSALLVFNTEPVSVTEPSVSNSDAFHFLEPLARNGGDLQKFDGSLLDYLTVEVCEVSGNGCPVIKTFTAQGQSSEQLRIATAPRNGGFYIVNWDTQRTNLGGKTYRVRVAAANMQFGSIELTPDVYNTFGRTWPIKFLIEADPEIRVRVLRFREQSASQIVSALKSEFNLCGQEAAALLAGDLRPFPQAEISVAISGVCQDVVIPDTTKVADEVTRNALLSYDPTTGRMVFADSTDVLKNLRRGDVFVSEPSGDAAPFGYLRKITNIRRVSGQVILETVQARLNEAIYQGTLNATGELLPNDGTQPPVISPLAASGFEDDSIPAPNIVIDEGDVFNFHRDIDVTINFDGSEDGVEGTGTVRVTGFVYFNAGYNVGIGIRPCLEVPPACPDRFEAWAGLEQKSRLRVTGNFDGEIHKEKIIHPIPMKPIWFFIGPVPVVLVPEINVKLGVDGEAHLDFVFEGEAKSKFKAGAKWLNPDYGGNGWNNISEYLPLDKKIHAADINAKLRVEGYAKVDAKIKHYGVVGPGIDGSVGILIDADTGRKPFWFMQGHVTTNISFEVGIADIIELERYSTPILNEYIHIAESTNSPPRFSNVNTGVIQADIATAITLGPRSGFFGHFDVMDLEGDVPILTANSNVDGPIGLTHSFQTGGLRTITITATDSDGATSSITLTVNVTNSQPIVTVTAVENTVPATEQYFVSARAFDFESGVLSCSRLSWQAAPSGTVTPLDIGGSCSATIIFSQEGPHTVTVRATDPQGGVGSGSISVNVTAAPVNRAPVVNILSFQVAAIPRPSTPRGNCSILLLRCPVTDGATLFNGVSGHYEVPLHMSVQASDPEGGAVTFQWFCQTGTQIVTATDIGNGVFSCTPIFSITNTTVTVYGFASDGVNSKPTPVRTLFWEVDIG